MNLMGNVA